MQRFQPAGRNLDGQASSHLVSKSHMNMFANVGPKGRPIPTPFFCSQNFPSKFLKNQKLGTPEKVTVLVKRRLFLEQFNKVLEKLESLQNLNNWNISQNIQRKSYSLPTIAKLSLSNKLSSALLIIYIFIPYCIIFIHILV